MKKCSNCGKYPFCNNTEGANFYCVYWIKKEIKRLVEKDGDIYNFIKMEDINEEE